MCPSSSSPQWLCGEMPAMDGQWQSSPIVSVTTNRANTAGMSPQSDCGDAENGRIGLSS